MVRITMIAIEQLASNFNSLLKYFSGYWETTKHFLLNIFNNEIITNKIFQSMVVTINLRDNPHNHSCLWKYHMTPTILQEQYAKPNKIKVPS